MPHECLAIIESKSKVHYSRTKQVVAKVSKNTSTFDISPDDAELKDMVKALLFDKKSQNQAPATVKAVEESCVTCVGAHSYRNYPATDGNVYRDKIQEFISQASANVQLNQRNNQNRFNQNQNQGNNFNHGPIYQPPVFQPPAYQAPAYRAPAPQTQGVSKEDFLAYIKDNDAVIRNIQTQGPNMQNQLTNLTDVLTKFVSSNNASTLSSCTLSSNTIANPKSDVKSITTRSGVSYDGPQILPPSSFLAKVVENEPEATKDTVHPTNNGSTKDVQPSIGDPGKFLISYNFPRKAECLALADLDASINLMPWSVWNKLPLPDLTPTCMTLELVDRLISYLVGVPEDVYVKVGTFHFSADFVVVDIDADPRVPLLLGRSFLKTGRALIDVFEGELTLRVGKEAITFNLDQTSRYSANYNDMTAKRIDVIDMDCEEYSQEVLGFFDVIPSGNPTPYYDPIVSNTSLTLTPFKNSDFLLEEVDAFLALEVDPTLPEVDQSYLDFKGDILLLEAFLNHDPSLPPPNQGNYLPEVCKKLKICEAKSDKSSIDEPPEEKTALTTVLKSHKRAIAWKLSDIKGIDLEFCTHKILMEEDFEPAVQHQRRVNPKIHDLIKQEVLKLLDAGLIYPISDSPWVSPVHCVPKKGGFTIVEKEKNELIPTRLVTGWRVCIDYRKLNEAIRKDHFPLLFMDQMRERLAENQYYCFLDGFYGYFQIPIDPKDQEKTTFTCPYGTFAYCRLPFGLCNALGTFQRYMMAIFHDMIEKTMEVFMDDFSVFKNSFQSCLSHLEKMLKRCKDTNICLNWEKNHFMVKEGIVLGHKISKEGIEFDKAKVDVITKLPYPTTVKAPILIAPDWDMPFELMCDASDFAIGAVLGQRQEKHFKPIHYANLDSLNSVAGGNFLDKIPRECLAIIESKSKVRYSRNKPVIAKVSTNTFTSGIWPDVAELKDMVKALLLDKKSQNQAPATVKEVEESCNVQLNQRNNQNRFNQNQNRGNNFNHGPIYQPSVFQPPAYQAPAPQTQGVLKEDFSAYVKANDAVMRNMQTQGKNMQNQLTNLTELLTKFMNTNSASTSSSGTLPSNTIANPRSYLKAITTRSGMSYDGPQIPPPTSFLPKVVENEPEATKDTVHPTNNRSTEDVQPLVVQSKSPILTSQPVNSLIY
nr:reverse transcriptase domain-containing protein [Tanacetum cinerariifolium]